MYDRSYQLSRLIGLWPHQIKNTSQKQLDRNVELLRKHLRGEAQRGARKHWTYDVNRHMALREALYKETQLAKFEKETI
jgi:hypothetical protein